MLRFIKKRSRKAGLPPGTPVHVGRERREEVRVTAIDYSEAAVEELEIGDVTECADFRRKPTVTWINVDGVHQVDLIERLGEAFDLHPLVMEDIANTGQRPKLEDYDSYVYVVADMLSFGEEAGGVEAEQVSLVAGEGYVISFQERPGDVFDAVRERIRAGKGRIRIMGADYLVYALLDAIVDQYFQICERLGEAVEPVHDELIEEPTPRTLQRVHELREEILFMRRSVWPLREVVSGLGRADLELFAEPTRLFLRDVYDHTIQVIETIESYRDVIGGMTDLYLSSVSNRMNEVMKVLTIIATIFIPLSFVAGLYGMNFDYMPELHWRWGYPAVLLVMAAVAATMLIYFRKRDWL